MSSPVRLRMLVLATALTVATLVAGCADTSDPVTGEGDSTESAGEEVTVPISAVTTSLVDPGNEPREVLGPRVAPDASQQVTLRTDFRVQQQIDDLPNQDFSAPPLAIPLTAALGNEGIGMTLGKVTTPDAALAKDLGPSAGSHAGLTVDPFGAVTALRIRPSAKAVDNARSAIEQALYQAVFLAVAFPKDPVGAGAVWTIRQQITGGVTLDQVTTATLQERDGNRLTIGLDVSQTPKAPVWNLPNGAGMLDIDAYASHGSGKVTLDLSLPLPVDGSVTIGGSQDLRDPKTSTRLRQTTSNLVQWGR
ncbi:hypothetical protein [Spelaeibacter cavernicola]|uniref:Lipoprotein n=1 Tax=Antrihabitans cavernicola TaxID=2495913 RepID=A0A5A7SF98_9NOCA|nr:hypothetical protein [Spelaeibacter cavernicola]KAA0023205.1 hypothetical protein FOY51_11845 [Spelaeibacter cavernicola]